MGKNRRRITEEDEYEVEQFLAERNDPKNKLSSLRSIQLKCKTPGQKELLNSIKENQITICSGRAGSGKTYITSAQSIKFLKANQFRKIILIKSVVPLKGEEIGYLKGSLEEKINPFIDSFIDNYDKIIGKSNFLEIFS